MLTLWIITTLVLIGACILNIQPRFINKFFGKKYYCCRCAKEFVADEQRIAAEELSAERRFSTRTD